LFVTAVTAANSDGNNVRTQYMLQWSKEKSGAAASAGSMVSLSSLTSFARGFDAGGSIASNADWRKKFAARPAHCFSLTCSGGGGNNPALDFVLEQPADADLFARVLRRIIDEQKQMQQQQ
jgi:hypothetical protein